MVCKIDLKCSYLERCAVTKHQRTAAVLGQNACFVALCCYLKAAESSLVPLHLHLCISSWHAGVQSPNTNALLQF